MKQFLLDFAPWWWTVWFAMLIIVDPIFSWLGYRWGIGDTLTDTHYIVRHISFWTRVVILIWLAIHFLIQHRVR